MHSTVHTDISALAVSTVFDEREIKKAFDNFEVIVLMWNWKFIKG